VNESLENLLDETLRELTARDKSPTEVRWVGSRDGKLAVSWAEFESIARDTDYCSGYGSTFIALDLVVVGDDWWLERSEYDGSEAWAYQITPVLRRDSRPWRYVAECPHKGWGDNLADYNQPDDL